MIQLVGGIKTKKSDLLVIYNVAHCRVCIVCPRICTRIHNIFKKNTLFRYVERFLLTLRHEPIFFWPQHFKLPICSPEHHVPRKSFSERAKVCNSWRNSKFLWIDLHCKTVSISYEVRLLHSHSFCVFDIPNHENTVEVPESVSCSGRENRKTSHSKSLLQSCTSPLQESETVDQWCDKIQFDEFNLGLFSHCYKIL